MSLSRIAVAPSTMERYVTELGRLGETPEGGLCRFQYDAAWCDARDLLQTWFTEAGLRVHIDAAGNIFGRLVGVDDSRTILTGSHLDTVPFGGKYDGALGILAGLAALKTLRDNLGQPQRSLEVVALCEEESSRFQANFFGSRTVLGLVEPSELESHLDAEGVSLRQAMASAGLQADLITDAARRDLDAFIELHIEQGRVLIDEQTDIGIVETITGLVWESYEIEGRTDHAGATPMDLRTDAMQAAIEMSAAITRRVEDEGRPAVVTNGQWNVHPGSPSAVPGRVKFSLDLRHTEAKARNELLEAVHEECAKIAERRNVRLRIRSLKDESPATLDPGLQQVCRESAEACGLSWKAMPSGAGHDSQLMAQHVPTAMVFVPSVEGRSHCPEEFTSNEDCARGATVLAAALARLAY
jgi:allantoate deiminase